MEEDLKYVLNMCDIEFLQVSSTHPNLSIKLSIKLFDLLSKIYLNDVVWSRSIFIPIKAIFPKFCEVEAFQDYIVKLVKLCLSMHVTSCKNTLKRTLNERDILTLQKQSLIIELVKFFIQGEIYNLNQSLKSLILSIY